MNDFESKAFGMSVEDIEKMCRKSITGNMAMLVMSLLSDAQDNMDITKDWQRSRKLINIAKYIISNKLETKKDDIESSQE